MLYLYSTVPTASFDSILLRVLLLLLWQCSLLYLLLLLLLIVRLVLLACYNGVVGLRLFWGACRTDSTYRYYTRLRHYNSFCCYSYDTAKSALTIADAAATRRAIVLLDC